MSDVTEFNVETQEETIREFTENENIGIEDIKEQSKVIAGS
jgi:hypothetical protein